MQIRKIFSSTIFRITLLYAAFFCISVIGILTFVYFATVREIESQIKHRINTQINQAQVVFAQHGLEELRKQLNELQEEDDEGLFIYLLVNAQGKSLIGNMESWPEDIEYSEKWLMFDIDSRNEEGLSHILALDKTLNDGYRLLIGYSLKSADRTRKVMFDVVSASIALTFVITAFGGGVFSGIIRRRLERVNHICRQVISGNLEVKVPTGSSGDEFDNLASNVNAMLARIVELVRGLKQTSDNIAHDLRTPLNRHRIRLEGLVNHPPMHNTIGETLKAGMEEIDTIVETLNSILRISQAEAGVASGHFIRFDLSQVVTAVTEFYEELAEQKSITLTTDIPANILAMGDKPLITQAIANLIDNAIKYTPHTGEVQVLLRMNEQDTECVVADNGSGIPPELYEKVKERFFRLEASRTSSGTGLGLSLVEAVATLHHGHLAFMDNQPGLRAVFRIANG